jgi:DNA repair exonuclease SbcCD ATPase subunit
MADMETTLKKRILYLEQYKLAVGSKLGRLQGKLDLSVPVEDFQALQKEIENLREDHLSALRREVEAKITTLQLQESSRELRAFKLSVQHLKADLHESQSISSNLALQLAHQQEVTAKALAVNNSTSELSSIVSEMARFRGEASRLEVEVIAANRRRELVNEQLIEVTKDLEVANKRIKEYQASEDDLLAKENQARKELLEINLIYNGGLCRQEAEDLKSRLEQVTRECDEIKHDTDRYKELAEIASHQAQVLGSIKSQRDEEFKVLSSHCAALESRGDDDILIGRLQRQLIAVKTSYKAFTRKYQMLRKNMVQRELHQRVLETTLDQREEAMHVVQESHRLEVGALKRAIRNISEAPEEDKHVSADIFDKMALKGLSKEQEFTMKFKIRLTLAQIDDAMKLHLDRKKGSTATNGQKLLQLSAKVGALSELAEESLKTTWEYEERNRNLNGELQDCQAEKELLTQKCQDLEAVLNSDGKYKQQVLASRLVSLSEDVRSNKLVTLQQRRQINVLRQEKKHLQVLFYHS